MRHPQRLTPAYLLRGFTLIEVLIAMTLLSLMVVLLFGSLKICADSWEKGEDKISDVNEVAVVYGFFQQHLALAQPLWDDFSQEDTRTFAFQGHPKSVQFVSSFPASADRDGLQLFTLELVDDIDDRYLKVTITPFFAKAEGEDWKPEEVTLVKHVSEFSLSYFDLSDGSSEGGWTEEWLERENLPRLVKVNIKLDNGIFWPEMIIPIKITGITDDTYYETEPEENPEDFAEPEPDPQVTQ